MPKVNEKQIDKAAELHSIVVGTFETELGKKCLAHMEKVYLNRPIYVKGATFEETAFREGQADVIRNIIREINRG